MLLRIDVNQTIPLLRNIRCNNHNQAIKEKDIESKWIPFFIQPNGNNGVFGEIKAQAVCFLYCWAMDDSPDASDQSRTVFNEIFVTPFERYPQDHAFHEWAKKVRYGVRNLGYEDELIRRTGITEEPPIMPRQGEQTMNESFRRLITDCIELLEVNYNLILTGAPGTGKTYLARHIAKSLRISEIEHEIEDLENALEQEEDLDKAAKIENELLPEKENMLSTVMAQKADEFGEFVQFHPSYDYTDFVEGLRPCRNKGSKAGNTIGFELKNGSFKKFCKEALKDKNRKYVFIIDEINRGEISKIFGELFFSIEGGYRGTKGKVMTQYANMQSGDTIFDPNLKPCQGWFYVPENVYIVGTMNDIDRSVESFDFAMRRRFIWKEITAEVSAASMGLHGNAIFKMNNLNEAITKKDVTENEALNSSYKIGAAYFLKVEDNGDSYDALWRLRLEPLLREYLRGMPNVDKIIEKLKTIYDENEPGNGNNENNGEIPDIVE